MHSLYTWLFIYFFVSIPKSVGDTLAHICCRQAMIVEPCFLWNSGTWDHIPQPFRKSIAGCRWIFVVKVGLDSTIDRLNACLVAKGYT